MPSKQPEGYSGTDLLLRVGEELRRQAAKPNLFNYKIDEKGCWIHRNKTMKNGYVQLTCDGRKILAHRLSYEVYNGSFDLSLKVCHSCDTPNCINPEHLFLGTQADNIQDKETKGRHGRTGKDPLTEDEEAFILTYHSMGKTYKEIADLVGVHRMTVGRYVRGERSNGKGS